jgi:hypothetical protein
MEQSVLWRLVKWAWRATRVALFVAAFSLGLPAETLSQALGWAMTSLLQTPIVLVLIVAAATLLATWDIAWWLAQRRLRRLQSPSADMSVRDMFTYLRTEAAVAYEFNDRRVWHQHVFGRVHDGLANENGMLASWGRATRHYSPKDYANLAPPQRLLPAYWLTHELDQLSCVDTSGRRLPAHTNYLLNPDNAMFDLHVNKRQVLAQFPMAPLFVRLTSRPNIRVEPVEIRVDATTITETVRTLDGLGTGTTTKAR